MIKSTAFSWRPIFLGKKKKEIKKLLLANTQANWPLTVGVNFRVKHGALVGNAKNQQINCGVSKTQKKEKKTKTKQKTTSLPLPNVFLNHGHRRGVLLLNRVQSQVLLHRQNNTSSSKKKMCKTDNYERFISASLGSLPNTHYTAE
jgi:hypothetical protein